MPCYHPLDAKLSPSGKPVFKNNSNYGRFAKLIKLPCGRCIGCRLDRSKTWAIRLMHEAQLHEANSFITLTYDTNSLPVALGWEPTVPYTPPSERGHRTQEQDARTKTRTRPISLNKRDAQLFTKRLNEYVRTKRATGVRYYLVGEYGETTQRPHYHAAVFGEAFFDDRYEWRTTDNGDTIYRSSRLEQLWPYGHCEIGDLTFKSAAYIARYITKKLGEGRTPESKEAFDKKYLRTDETGANYYIEQEFSNMSRRPGIGKRWLDKYKTDVYPHDYVVMNGQKLKPPRFYDKLLEASEPLTMEQLKKEREVKQLLQAADSTPDRLRAKEAVATAKLNLNKRTI